jgi:hypothetical protein
MFWVSSGFETARLSSMVVDGMVSGLTIPVFSFGIMPGGRIWGPITPTPQCTCLAPVFAYISNLAIVHPPSISYTLILLILSSQHSTILNCTPIRSQYPSAFVLQFAHQLAPQYPSILPSNSVFGLYKIYSQFILQFVLILVDI